MMKSNENTNNTTTSNSSFPTGLVNRNSPRSTFGRRSVSTFLTGGSSAPQDSHEGNHHLATNKNTKTKTNTPAPPSIINPITDSQYSPRHKFRMKARRSVSEQPIKSKSSSNNKTPSFLFGSTTTTTSTTTKPKLEKKNSEQSLLNNQDGTDSDESNSQSEVDSDDISYVDDHDDDDEEEEEEEDHTNNTYDEDHSTDGSLDGLKLLQHLSWFSNQQQSQQQSQPKRNSISLSDLQQSGSNNNSTSSSNTFTATNVLAAAPPKLPQRHASTDIIINNNNNNNSKIVGGGSGGSSSSIINTTGSNIGRPEPSTRGIMRRKRSKTMKRTKSDERQHSTTNTIIAFNEQDFEEDIEDDDNNQFHSNNNDNNNNNNSTGTIIDGNMILGRQKQQRLGEMEKSHHKSLDLSQQVVQAFHQSSPSSLSFKGGKTQRGKWNNIRGATERDKEVFLLRIAVFMLLLGCIVLSLMNHILHRANQNVPDYLRSSSNNNGPSTVTSDVDANNDNDKKDNIPMTNLDDLFQPSAEGRIIGGTNVGNPKNEYPWFVLFHGSSICGGALITSDIVLTAAHCIGAGKVSESNNFVYLGAQSRNADGLQNADMFHIAEERPHERYLNNVFAYDIMLVKLQSSVPKDKYPPITLIWNTNDDNDDDNNYNNDNDIDKEKAIPIPKTDKALTVIGYGDIDKADESVVVPDILQETKVTYVDFDMCWHIYEAGAIAMHEAGLEAQDLTKDQMCAEAPDAGACSGDSGGPLFIKGDKDDDGLDDDILVGTVAWHRGGCGNNVYPDVYSNVTWFADWILSNVCDMSDDTDNFQCQKD